MNKSKSYFGIDLFRFIAAILIITIHTSPLSSFSDLADFTLTRIIARIAVPFFFMTSGFFLVSRFSSSFERIKGFIKNTLLIYLIATLLYIPINIYSGYFSANRLFSNIIKDIIFDGTFYHLWYLPASVAGILIAYALVRKLGTVKALCATSVLYIAGLLGDSYYGLAEKLPVLRVVYSSLFEIFDFTRNGIFFAPIFFVLGTLIAEKREKLSLKISIIGFALSSILMTAEGLLLHSFDLQLHDSMYIFLLPVMYFLFTMLTFIKGKRIKLLRTSALVIYIVHPMVIVGVRFAAKIINTEELFIENSIVHFLAVAVISVAFSLVFTLGLDKLLPKKPTEIKCDRSWIEIDSSALRHNVEVLRSAMPEKCKLMAIMKAESYGHGAQECAEILSSLGVDAYAVATADEGIALRKYGLSGEILVLGYTDPKRAFELHKYSLIQSVFDTQYAAALNATGIKNDVHIKIDTGMHRLGFAADDIGAVKGVFEAKNLHVSGIFTHLCVCDSFEESDLEFTKKQTESFYRLLSELEKDSIDLPKIHIQSSYGLLNYPELSCDYARIGISLYGVPTSYGDKTKLSLHLKPVLSLKTKIVTLHKIKAGEDVGYGRTFTAERDTVVAVLPIGYADGYPRNLSCGVGEVIINGQKAPIIGRVCMDQLTVDVTDIKDVQRDCIVTLIGKDGDAEIRTEEVAHRSQSISNELLSRLGQRLKIIVKN